MRVIVRAADSDLQSLQGTDSVLAVSSYHNAKVLIGCLL